MLRSLLAGIGLWMGAQFLLPPAFVESTFVGSSIEWLVGSPGEAIAAELDEIRDRGHLIVAVKTNRPPLSFLDENGNLVGYEIDIARRLAAELLGDETAVEFVPVSNLERLDAVLEGRVDMAIAAITLTEPRRRLINFSDPYYLDGTAFLVRPTQQTQTLQDLQLSQIAVLNRSSTIAHVRYILPGAQLIGVDSYQQGQRVLSAGEVDAFAGDASVLTGWVNQPSAVSTVSNYQLLPDVISVEPLAIALPKGTQYNDLQAAINRIIKAWYTEEWLQARADYWNLPSGVLPSFLDTEPETELETEPETESGSAETDE
ncbi:MAG: transporter substrate-binding domain-containing protein [Cyanobacteria bacterium J06621_3]